MSEVTPSLVPPASTDRLPDALREAITHARMAGLRLGDPLLFYESTGSTNDVASTLAAQGAPHGALVVADRQTKGRGRMGREWFSPGGAGLYFSLVVRPEADAAPGAGALLTIVAGVAASEALEQATGLRASIKWPNDLVVEERPTPAGRSRRRKLAGILAEGTIVAGVIQHVVLGIGINLRDTAYPQELRERVTSVERETGRDPSREDVLVACLERLDARWRHVADGQAGEVLAAWRARAPAAVGAAVRVTTSGGVASGRTDGVEDDGTLRVIVGGRLERVVAGEVEWL